MISGAELKNIVLIEAELPLSSVKVHVTTFESVVVIGRHISLETVTDEDS